MAMPRQAILDTPGTLHHIIIRRIEKGKIVGDKKDRQNFLSRMGKLASESRTVIYAWTLIEESGGMYRTIAGINHLSFFNLDWWYPLGPFFPSAGAMLRFQGPDTAALSITARKKVDNTYIDKYLIQVPMGEDYPIGGWGLGDVPVILEIRNMCNLTPHFEEIIDPSQGIYEIYLPNTIPDSADDVLLFFEGWCPNNPDVIIRPSTPFVYKDECNGGFWIWDFMVDGHATINNVQLFHLYKVGVYYDGNFHEEAFIFDGTDLSYSIEFTYEVCNIIAP